jgi:DNA invertase Pin-like site-specific DNA recombinase
MMKAVNAKEFDMVAAWSVDRLGRSLTEIAAYGIARWSLHLSDACR